MPPVWRQVRWLVLTLVFLVTVVNFVDRQTLSVVAPVIREKFHLSNTDYGRIVWEFAADSRSRLRGGRWQRACTPSPDRHCTSRFFASGWVRESAEISRAA
jgi:hypothetical protein